MSQQHIALVTGANRGIGYAAAQVLAANHIQVILSSRDVALGLEAQKTLKAKGILVDYYPLDVADQVSRLNLFNYIVAQYGRLDILINNAGVFLDVLNGGTEERPARALDTSLNILRTSLEINTFGPYALMQQFIPLMVENGYGRIVNVTSAYGQVSGMGSHFAGYKISKASLNAITRIFAAEVMGTNILINAIDPGTVATDMQKGKAHFTPIQAAERILELARLPYGGPSGKLFFDGQLQVW